jgi:hypothetical protein
MAGACAAAASTTEETGLIFEAHENGPATRTSAGSVTDGKISKLGVSLALVADAYPLSAESVLRTLSEFFRAQGEDRIHMLLESCSAQIAEDFNDSGWDNSTYYELHIQARPDLYAQFEDSFEKIEKLIDKRLVAISSGKQGHRLIRCRFMLQMAQVEGHPTVNRADQDRIWTAGAFRVFLSHRSDDRADTATLKNDLSQYGISAFVAHADIQVTREWEDEIMRALLSMQCLVALVTPNFHESFWCNQEIGVALGRGVQVVSVKLEAVPQGFAGSKQGMPGSLSSLDRMAKGIVEVLLRTETTAAPMRVALIEAIVHSSTFVGTQACVRQLMRLKDFTSEDGLSFLEDQNYIFNPSYFPGSGQSDFRAFSAR